MPVLGVRVVIVRFSVATKQPRRRTMTVQDSALSDLAARLAGSDSSLSTSLRDILAAGLQELIWADLTSTVGAAPGEHTPDHTAQRNGHRPKALSTPARAGAHLLEAARRLPRPAPSRAHPHRESSPPAVRAQASGLRHPSPGAALLSTRARQWHVWPGYRCMCQLTESAAVPRSPAATCRVGTWAVGLASFAYPALRSESR